MYKTALACVAAALAIPPGSLAADFEFAHSEEIASEVLGEQRELWISLPASYRPGGYRRYPVLYLLDPDLNSVFHAFTGILKQLAADASPPIPELIVVGIVGRHRVRDSSPTRSLVQYGGKQSDALAVTGGAGRFLAFIAEELIPYVDATYESADYRILAGYSFTGLPVLEALYQTPETFNAYLATDPSMWWDDRVMLRRLAAFRERGSPGHRRLFVSTSQRVPSVYPDQNYVLEFIRQLEAHPVDGLAFGSKVYDARENHHTMPVVSFYDGLRFIFDGYMVDDGIRFRPAHELAAHFEAVSGKLGADFMPSESLVNWFGYERLYSDQFLAPDPAAAVDFFELNVRYYPASANAWDSLGEAYVVMGDAEKALEAYRRSLSLNPDNKNASERIRTLEQARIE